MSDRPTFQAVARHAVSDAVHEQLRDAILDGKLAPGDSLPSERTLAEEFGVNRHAVREAVKRLQEARLVEVAHGGATRVLDWRRTAGLEVLTDLATSSGMPSADALLSVLEMRLSIGVDAVRLCARRADSTLLAELRRAVDDLRTATDAGAPLSDLAQRYDELWYLIVQGSDNIAYRLAHNSLIAAIARFVEPFADAYEPEVRDVATQDALVTAIADRDPDEAATIAERILTRLVNPA